MIVGTRRDPIRLSRLEPERIVKIPSAVADISVRRPSRLENIMFIIIKIEIMIIESVL